MDLGAKVEREARFWDGKQSALAGLDPALYRVTAADLSDRAVPWLPYLGFPDYVRHVLDHVGDLRGARVLDLGCGTGYMSCLLAARGAQVDAVDVSEASLEVARWRAEISGLGDRIHFHVAPAEALPFPDGQFDGVCGAFALHHLDLAVASPELRRVLRPGGRGAFIETCGHNVLLMTARRILPGRFGIEKASSDDEAPLGRSAQELMNSIFDGTVKMEYPSTLFFRMLSYVPPMHLRPMQHLLSAVDRLIHKVPAFRTQSYFGVVVFQRSDR